MLPITLATAGMAWNAHERVSVAEGRATIIEQSNNDAHERMEKRLDKQDTKLDQILEKLGVK